LNIPVARLRKELWFVFFFLPLVSFSWTVLCLHKTRFVS
jgi:hypothetical protein